MAWDDRSPSDQTEIGYCAPRGIPVSVFRGRVVYPGDPAWTDDDRQAVYDWLEHEANTCVGCGQDLRESMRKENSFAYRAEGLRCHACYAVHGEAARLTKAKTSPIAGIDRYRIMGSGVTDGRVQDTAGVGQETRPVGPRGQRHP